MSFQIYFLQSEEDAVQFLDHISNLGAVIWYDNEFHAPDDMKDTVTTHMASFMHQYFIIPGGDVQLLSATRNELQRGLGGVEFVTCSKGNAQSRTYDVGRLYCRNDDCNPYNAQIIALYKSLKSYVVKNYHYSKHAKVYCAPIFKANYEAKRFYATWLGQPITL